jgi:hypothetical protein
MAAEKLTKKQVEQIANALEDASSFLHRLRAKNRLPQRESADLLNRIAEAVLPLGLLLPGITESK